MSQSAVLPAQPLTLIKAGAGSGKTYTIQSTLTDLIKQGKVKADRVLAVTFTTDAANEMESRTRVALMKEGMMTEARLLQKSTISTIHAFGLEILKTFAYETGKSPAPRQLSEQEQNFLLRKALDQVQAIEPLLEDLKHYGYSGGFKGDEYQDPGDQLTSTILSLINKLRALGKGLNTSSAEARALLEQAKAVLTNTYGHVQKDGAPLADTLWGAIEAVKTEFPEQDTLSHKKEWGNNSETRTFVANLYSATRERLNREWKLWADLQYTDNFKKILEKHARSDLAEAIWNAAEKLSVHPGPLEDALQHIECLIIGAQQTLDVYQGTKEQAGLVDYNDMVHLANDMLHSHPEWLKEIASNYDCLIIDEFQDTNPLQYALLRCFQDNSQYTLIVGDLKQSIMGFQGSDSRLFYALLNEEERQSGTVKKLDSNWRSTPALMGFINDMGSKLYGDQYQPLEPKAGYESGLPAVQALRFSKDLWNQNANAKSPKPGFTGEGNTALANHIADLLASDTQVTDRYSGEKRPIHGADIAVLARGHKRLDKFAKALRSAGIEVQIQQPGFLSCDAVQWTLNALQGLNNSRDHYAWLDLLTSPLLKGLSSERLKALLTSYGQGSGLEHELKKQLLPLRKNLQVQPVKTQVLRILEEARLFEKLLAHPQGPQCRANLIKLIGLAEEFETLQPETLNAMGIAGKNASTFQVWLSQNKDSLDEQPSSDPQAENAVVLKTWHSAKGLEWPVVMVLDAEKASDPRFPNITMAYPDGDIDAMLQHSFVQVLPQFDDKPTKERFTELLKGDEEETNKNLYYVALTRAREQIILPIWEDFKDGSMLSLIEPLMSARAKLGDSTLYAETQVTPTAAEPKVHAEPTRKRVELQITENDQPEKLKHTVSPSLDKAVDNGHALLTVPTIVTRNYIPTLNLDAFKGIPANELGTWVHRLYQVYFMQPALLDKALAEKPGCVTDEGQKQAVIAHLDGFKAHLEKIAGAVRQWQCEIPVSGMNSRGQVESGEVDLVVEGELGSWLVDHKTDISRVPDLYVGQLLAYQRMVTTKKSLKLAINWSRIAWMDEVQG